VEKGISLGKNFRQRYVKKVEKGILWGKNSKQRFAKKEVEGIFWGKTLNEICVEGEERNQWEKILDRKIYTKWRKETSGKKLLLDIFLKGGQKNPFENSSWRCGNKK